MIYPVLPGPILMKILTQTNIYGAVAYSYGSQDSVTEYIDKMDQQVICIQEFNRYAEAHNIIVNPQTPYTYYTDWDQTTAPNGEYSYYARALDAIQAGFSIGESLTELDAYEYPPGSGMSPLFGIRPYVPAFATYKLVFGEEPW